MFLNKIIIFEISMTYKCYRRCLNDILIIVNDIKMFLYEMGARQQDMVYTHWSCERVDLPKIDPWVTQTTLNGRVAAIVIEVCGEQPEVNVKVHLHAILVLSHFTRR